MWQDRDSQEVGLEAAILQRKRNSSLVKSSRAENITGLKPGTEATGAYENMCGRGASHVERRSTGRAAGPHGSADADMSSDKACEIHARRKSKVSWGRPIRPGLAGS